MDDAFPSAMAAEQRKGVSTVGKTVAGVGLGILVVAGIAVWAVLQMLPLSFCDLVLALDVAFDAGENIRDAVEEFWAKVTDEMVAGLPDKIRVPAEVLLAAIEGALALPRLVASILFDRIDPALDAAATACRTVG